MARDPRTLASPTDAMSAPAADVLFQDADGVADTEATVRCPWCTRPASIALDPGSGPDQTYSEDCPVCCRAWAVRVRYGGDGRARVDLTREDDA